MAGAGFGLLPACEADSNGTEFSAAGSGGSGAEPRDAGAGGSPPTLVTYCSGATALEPSPHAETLRTCEVEEPCAGSGAQLVEMQSRNIGGGSACLLAALAERRTGRYRHETDSTWSNGDAGALHTLIVHADGSVSYVSEAHQCLASTTPIDPLPPAAPHRCALKPPGYFEACTAELAGRADAGPLRADSDAWACVFGDGDGLTPNNLYWFESCASEAAPACE